MDDRTSNSAAKSKRVQTMALNIDWTFLNDATHYEIRGDGFSLYNYGHPTFVRFIDADRRLTLAYSYIDETPERGRRFLVLRTYGIHLQIPTELAWDDGTELSEVEANTVLHRICQLFEKHKKRKCRVVINDSLYRKLAAVDDQLKGTRVK